MCVHACICRGQRETLGVLFYHLHHILLRQVLSLNLEAGLMAIPSDPPTLALDSVGVTGRHGHAQCFMWVLGPEFVL